MTPRIVLCLLLGASLLQAQESRIELRSHYSAILSQQKNYNIYLPEDYDREHSRYPVIYLFRGHEREWANPAEDGSRVGNIKTVADRLYARNTIGKMILVMPGLSQPGTGPDFDYVAKELIPYIDATYRTLPYRQKRGMDGFSYGGYDMLQLLRRSPEQFFTAGAYDGSFWVVNLNDFFAAADESYWSLLRQMRFLIHSTPAGNYSSNVQFLSILNAHGIENAFDTLSLGANTAHNWYFADLHMERSLPLHWEHFQNGAREIPLTLHSPAGGTTIVGTTTVTWSVAPHSDTLRTLLEYSRDRGATWKEIYSSTREDTSYNWNTSLVPDGTGYLLRVSVLSDTLFGLAKTSSRFTINNPGNATPEVGILFPDSSRTLTGVETIRWWAEDADGDTLNVSIDASADDGATWVRLYDHANTGQISWNTPAGPNSGSYRIRIVGRDAWTMGEAVSARFEVYNLRPYLRPDSVHHVAGDADGSIRVVVAEPSAVSGHRYRVVFQDSVSGPTSYAVLDLSRGTVAVPFTSVSVPDREGPLFDGLRLVFADISPPRLSKDSTRWITGTSNLIPDVFLATADTGTGVLTGLPSLCDYQIRIYGHAVDTSSALFGWNAVPMNFQVWNVTENRKAAVLFTDLNNDGMISQYDDLILLDTDSKGRPALTWELFFGGTSSVALPVPGDVFLLKILKSFTSKDVYEFIALPGGLVSVSPPSSPQSFILFQNYPNPFNPSTVVCWHLPVASDVKLVVYDLLGREVATLVDERKGAGTYQVVFDARLPAGGHGVQARGLASGVYFYRLSAGDYIASRKMVLAK
jgi:hypothetical protein